MTKTEPAVLVRWSDRYSVGIQQIDDQHRRLVDLLNELWRATMDGHGPGVISTTLNSLVAYTIFHFNTEEQLLKSHSYPDFEKHRLEHESLKTKVVRMRQDLLENKGVTARELIQFLQDWIVRHIVMSDKRYTAHLNSAGVS